MEHTYRIEYYSETEYAIKQIRSDGIIRNVDEDHLGYIEWKKKNEVPIVNYSPPPKPTLEELKQIKLDEIQQRYMQEIDKGTEAMPLAYPGVLFSIREESIIRYKGTLEFASLTGLTHVPFLNGINEDLVNIPLATAYEGCIKCTADAMILYKINMDLTNLITKAQTEEELEQILWPS